MNIFNIKIIKIAISLSLKKGYINYIPYVYKLFPYNWCDHEGNNLFHFAARHQNEYLFNLAIHNKANINKLDNNGNAPIHRFIEACFLLNDKKHKKDQKVNEYRGKIIFESNDELLKKFIEYGMNVNLWIENKKVKGEWGEGVATFSRNNIMGSPIELLVSTFWREVLDYEYVGKHDNISTEKYNKTYSILSNAGAKINLIVNTGTFFDLEKEPIKDAMQMTHSIVVSHFFIKYIRVENDLYGILPFLTDPNIDFKLKDDHGNTILHHLFGRITAKYSFLSSDKVDEVLTAIFNNPSFNESHLEIENSFRLSAIKCFKKDANQYATYLRKLILSKNLHEKLIVKEPIKAIKKVNKI